MSKTETLKKELEKAPQLKPSAISSIESLLNTPSMKKKFEDMLGKKAAGFMSSILSAVGTNQNLRACDPMSVVSSAAIGASLDLPINPSLGFAYIVPYGGRAQFQVGWKGFVQLAMRSGQYERMNCSEVYEDELDYYDPITGEIKFKDVAERKQRNEGVRGKIIGYVSFFRLLNGFTMYLYMTKGQVESHGREYSRSFGSANGNWKLRFDAMAKKTVLKMLLSKFGIMSIDMQRAVQADQAVIEVDGSMKYIDAPEQSIVELDDQPANEANIDASNGEIPIGADGKPIEF